MMPVCGACKKEQKREDARYCDYCGMETIRGVHLQEFKQKIEDEEALHQSALVKSETVTVNTLPTPPNNQEFQVIGLVFGTSSKLAFWGLSTQADRLTRAYSAALSNLKYEAALIDADAVLGVQFALNNSTGSSVLNAGSSEAVMLLGTAIRYL
jgi:uncharacterized protein YbjQ (UPF0145 family)